MRIGFPHAAFSTFLLVSVWSTSAQPPSLEGQPDAIVAKLYKAHAAKTGPFFNSTKRPLLEQYFTKELAGLILKDAIASKGEVGALDFDPLYASQDPSITDFKIAMATRVDRKAAVDASFKDLGQARRVRFQLEQNSAGDFRIADINYPDGTTILQLLRTATASNRKTP